MILGNYVPDYASIFSNFNLGNYISDYTSNYLYIKSTQMYHIFYKYLYLCV